MSQDKPVASPMGPTVQKNISLSLERLKIKERESHILSGLTGYSDVEYANLRVGYQYKQHRDDARNASRK